MSYKIFSTKETFKFLFIHQNARFENILTYFLTFAYYIFASPFKVKTNDLIITVNPTRLSSWFPQKCLCAFSSILVILWQLLLIRESFPSIGNVLTPSTYFGLGITASTLMIKVTFTKQVWRNNYKFLGKQRLT